MEPEDYEEKTIKVDKISDTEEIIDIVNDSEPIVEKPEPIKKVEEPEVKVTKPIIIPNTNGPLDRGGTPNKRLNNVKKVHINDTISSLEAELHRLQKQHFDMPMPKGDAKIKRKRYVINTKIKKAQKKLDAFKISQVNKEPIQENDVEKYENLAKQIGYTTKNMKAMSKFQFQCEKTNILDKAMRTYTESAKVITEWIIVISQGTDNYKTVSGYSINLRKNRKNIELQVKRCLIREGMKGKNMADMFSNPYIGLGIALGFPLVTTYMANRNPNLKKNSPTRQNSNEKVSLGSRNR